MATPSNPAIREHLRDLKRRQARQATIDHRRSVLRRFAVDVEADDVLQVTIDDLEAWRDDVADRVSIASLKSYVCQVRAFYQWAHRARLVEEDPSAELHVPRVMRGGARPIGEDDLALALRCAQDPIRTWLALASFCGLRACEIAWLGHEGLVKVGGEFVLDVIGKGGKPRTVPCPEPVVELLRPHLRNRGGAVFRTQAGKPVDPRYVSGAVSRYLQSIGVMCTLHQCRHYYGSTMYEQTGQDLRVVQELLGHADPTTTTIYVKASAARGRAAADQLAKMLTANSRVTPPAGRRDDGEDEAA